MKSKNKLFALLIGVGFLFPAGFLAQYNTKKLQEYNNFFFALKYVNTEENETVLDIRFQQRKEINV